jgi:hypothetical protein
MYSLTALGGSAYVLTLKTAYRLKNGPQVSEIPEFGLPVTTLVGHKRNEIVYPAFPTIRFRMILLGARYKKLATAI